MAEPAGRSALEWIEQSPLATAMRQDLWLYPSVEILHILGFVTLVGSIAMLDLRLLGLSGRLPVRLLARHLLPWTWGALLVIVPTGTMMFIAHASDFMSNRAFILKLTLIFAAALNAAAFHLGPFRSVARWDSEAAPPPTARLHAAFSLVIWAGVIACGRLMAYI
jgi:hypothetical protein